MSPKYFLLIIFFILYSFYIKTTKNPMIKIMCIGDSITYGHMPGSYRKFLYHNLIKKGYKIKMLGANSNKIKKYYYTLNNSEYFEYQDNNSGFPSCTISSFGKRKGLLEILEKNECLKLNPDIIILQIGTNNIMENYIFNKTIKDFISLINFILYNMSKEAIIFVATIPDMNPNIKRVYKWFDNYRKNNCDDNEVKNNVKNYIKKFNKEVKEIIGDLRNKNYNVRIVDLNKIIKDTDKLLLDGVHPNDKGYKKMGNFWTEIIDNYLTEKFIKTNQ